MNGPADAPSEWVCVAEDGSVDHDWKYQSAGDGYSGWWECRVCGEIDAEREPPSYDDFDDIF